MAYGFFAEGNAGMLENGFIVNDAVQTKSKWRTQLEACFAISYAATKLISKSFISSYRLI